MRKDIVKNREERIGIEFTTNEDYQVIVIDYITNKKVQVMFLDDYKYKMWTTWNHLKNGSLKNPFHKSVYGVGFLGLDENGIPPKTRINGVKTREYQLWASMMERCCNDNYQKAHPTYKNTTVCDRWHCYSTFLQDLPKIKDYELWRDNPQQKISLNKDIYYVELGINTDCKEYSLLTTRFITNRENAKDSAERRWKD